MHDLAKSIAASDSTTFYSKGQDIYEKTRRVSFDITFLLSSGIPISLNKASRIRTFYLPSESRYEYAGLDESTCNAIVSSLKFIRYYSCAGATATSAGVVAAYNFGK